MDENPEIERIIENNIDKPEFLGTNYNSLSPTMKKHLYKVESYLQSYTSQLFRLSTELKSLKINVVSVAEKTGVPRSTIYHKNSIIKTYIENRISEILSSEIYFYNNYNDQKQRNIELKSYLEKVQYDLIKLEISEYRIKELEAELKTFQEQEYFNNKEMHRLLQENKKLKATIEKSKIIKFE